MRLKVGDRVRIYAPPDDEIAAPIVKFNGMITKVTSSKPLYVCKGVGTAQMMYECEHVASVYGIPYSLIGEWLYELGSENEERL